MLIAIPRTPHLPPLRQQAMGLKLREARCSSYSSRKRSYWVRKQKQCTSHIFTQTKPVPKRRSRRGTLAWKSLQMGQTTLNWKIQSSNHQESEKSRLQYQWEPKWPSILQGALKTSSKLQTYFQIFQRLPSQQWLATSTKIKRHFRKWKWALLPTIVQGLRYKSKTPLGLRRESSLFHNTLKWEGQQPKWWASTEPTILNLTYARVWAILIH